MMKRVISVSITLLGFFSPSIPQTLNRTPLPYTQAWYTVPGYTVTSSFTCVVGYATGCALVLKRSGTSSDPAVCSMDISSNGQTVTIQDRNNVTWISGYTLGTSGQVTTYLWQRDGDDSGCRVFPGGIYIEATGSGTTTLGQLVVKFNP